MPFHRHLMPAWDMLAQHRIRSLLTVLGITIGMASTVIMMALGRGVQQEIDRQFDQAGLTLMTITGRPPLGATVNDHWQYELRWGDYLTLTEPGIIPGLDTIVPVAKSPAIVRWQGQEIWGELLGVTPAYLQASGRSLALGDFIREEDNQGLRLVAVLGAKLAGDLFGADAYPLNLWLTLYGKRIRVVGVMAPRGTQEDRQILLPFLTVQKRLLSMVAVSGEPLVDEIQVRIAEAEQIEPARRAIQNVLRRQRGIGSLDHDDFEVVRAVAEREALHEITATMTTFLAAIAAISLLVGGIGVTNIMLVSLGERTREIGIRYAIGACVRDITLMFLMESILLCTVGGVLGLAVCAYGILLLRGPLDIPASLGPDIVLLALAISMAVGLLSGVYPALRARRVTPAEALRSL